MSNQSEILDGWSHGRIILLSCLNMFKKIIIQSCWLILASVSIFILYNLMGLLFGPTLAEILDLFVYSQTILAELIVELFIYVLIASAIVFLFIWIKYPLHWLIIGIIASGVATLQWWVNNAVPFRKEYYYWRFLPFVFIIVIIVISASFFANYLKMRNKN